MQRRFPRFPSRFPLSSFPLSHFPHTEFIQVGSDSSRADCRWANWPVSEQGCKLVPQFFICRCGTQKGKSNRKREGAWVVRGALGGIVRYILVLELVCCVLAACCMHATLHGSCKGMCWGKNTQRTNKKELKELKELGARWAKPCRPQRAAVQPDQKDVPSDFKLWVCSFSAGRFKSQRSAPSSVLVTCT